MTRVWTVMLLALCISLVGSRDPAHAQPLQQLNPKAAQQFATDSEKASRGDADAAYRMGEAFESGRLGGLKDLSKALAYYRMAAQNGHQDADCAGNHAMAMLVKHAAFHGWHPRSE